MRKSRLTASLWEGDTLNAKVSANRTRLLFADDTDLLARARSGIVDRPEFDVVLAASTDEALQHVAGAPQPGAVVLPADGAIDGLQICRVVKAAANGGRVPVILALPANESSKRDACFAAGADDVLFAPVEVADVAARLDRATPAFRGAPRAEVELVVRLASPIGNAVIDAMGSQLSREALQVTLPAGMPPVPAGQLVRAVFTLYEGGTLQVWARVAAPLDSRRVVLRLVGLTEPELRAIDYFVDFYLKRTATAPDATNGGAPAAGASAEELLQSAAVPEAPARPVSAAAPTLAPGETVRLLAEASLDELAAVAAVFSSGREGKVPRGFDSARIRAWIPKLSSTETSALRGTTMYNNILGDLRSSAAARLRLAELTAALREAGTSVDGKTAESAVLSAIAEAQQIHSALDAGFHDMIKAGNTSAMRDLQPVKAGLLSACVELKAVLDRDVLGKEAAAAGAKAAPKAAPSQAKYTLDVAQKAEPRPERMSKESKSTPAPEGSGAARKIGIAVLLVALAGGAAWSNLSRFSPATPPIFRPDTVLFEVQGVRVWNSTSDGETITWILDGSWDVSNEEARTAAVDEMARRSAGMKRMRVIDYRAKELVARDLE